MTRAAVLLLAAASAVAAPTPKEVAPLPRTIGPAETYRVDPGVGAINFVALPGDGKLVAAGAGGIAVYDLAGRKALPGPKAAGPILTGARAGDVYVFGGEKAQAAYRLSKDGWTELAAGRTASKVGAVAVSPDGKRYLYQDGEKLVRLAEIGAEKPGTTLDCDTLPLAVALGPTGRHVAVAGRDGWLRYRSSAAGGKDAQIWSRRVQRGERNAVAISPDGRFVATCSAGRVAVFDALTSRQVAGLERRFGEGDVQALAFSADGSMLACGFGGEGAVVRLWNAEYWKEMGDYGSFPKGVASVAFGPDGKALGAAGPDGLALVWTVNPPTIDKPDLALSAAWETLDSDDPKKSQAALARLLRAGPDGAAVVAAGVKRIDADFADIRKWIKQLDNEAYRVREKAKLELMARGQRIAPALYELDPKKLSPEALTAVTALKTDLENKGFTPNESGLFGDALRKARAVQVLERADAKEAREALEILAKGEEKALSTREAKAALGVKGK